MITKKTVRDIWDESVYVLNSHFDFLYGDFGFGGGCTYPDKNVTPQEEVLFLLAMRERIDIKLQSLRTEYLRDGRYKDHEAHSL